jgi:4-oxalocrotonate tautomerase
VPLARIDLLEGRSAEYRQTIADVVYDQMIATLGAPEGRFQVISEHPADRIIADPDFLGIYRSEDCIFIQLFLPDVATAEQKGNFYMAVVDELHDRLLVRREDVVFTLITVEPANWSMGRGIAAYGHGVPPKRLESDSRQHSDGIDD